MTTTEIPKAGGLKLTGIYMEKTKGRWVAVWRTAKGNIVHDEIAGSQGWEKDAAREYAEANPPTWGLASHDAWLAERARGEMAQ